MTRRAYRGERLQELAWALIRDATDDPQLANDWYLDLSIEIANRLPSDDFQVRASDVVTWLEASPLHPSDPWPTAGSSADGEAPRR
jgi:hypothetical protein